VENWTGENEKDEMTSGSERVERLIKKKKLTKGNVK